MKSNKNTIGVRILVFILVIAVGFFSTFLWWFDSTGPVDEKDTTPVAFRVEAGDGVRVIAARLASDNLVRSSTAFFLLVKMMGLERALQAGEFRLSKSMDSRTIAQSLTHGVEDVWVTTLEGWRNEEVATELAKTLDIPESEFLKTAKLGYMFPDTYRVPSDATAGGMTALFEDVFAKKVTQELAGAIRASGMSLSDVITLASIVEREGRTNEDRPVIAGILLNRLDEGWPLQTDATLQFALGYQPQEKTWWKKALTEQDKKVNSPYNTYMHTGLPPGPISNPGIDSIRAVLYPKRTGYFFYLHDSEGGVHYAETLEQHNANVERYLR